MDLHFRWSRNGKLRATEQELRELGFPKAKVIGFGIPALRSADGFKTCPFAGTCAGGCYARDGRYHMDSTQQALEHNLKMVRHAHTLKDCWWDDLADEDLERLNPTHVRLHHSGDFFDHTYLTTWLQLAGRHPDIMFYGYTKMPGLDRIGPDNWRVIQSEGGTHDFTIGHLATNCVPHSRVFTSEEALYEAGYENCAHTDTALILGARRVGLVLHGQKALSQSGKLIAAGWVHN
jgi:hypothetical protein